MSLLWSTSTIVSTLGKMHDGTKVPGTRLVGRPFDRSPCPNVFKTPQNIQPDSSEILLKASRAGLFVNLCSEKMGARKTGMTGSTSDPPFSHFWSAIFIWASSQLLPIRSKPNLAGCIWTGNFFCLSFEIPLHSNERLETKMRIRWPRDLEYDRWEKVKAPNSKLYWGP